MGDSDDDDYVDIGRPDLVGLLPDEISTRLKDELFSTIQPEHLELMMGRLSCCFGSSKRGKTGTLTL